jgi:hypothetical protein
VLKAEIFLVEVRALRQPSLEVAGGFDHIHGGNDSGGGNGKSNSGECCGIEKPLTRGTGDHTVGLCVAGDTVCTFADFIYRSGCLKAFLFNDARLGSSVLFRM